VSSLAPYAFILVPIIKVIILVFAVLTADAYLTWLERKVIGHIQARWGPYRVGPHGLLQPLADGVKFILKEDPMPSGVDKKAYFFAPFLSLMLALTSLAVIPFGPDVTILGYKTNFGIADINISLLALFAITALSVYGIALAGWSSNNKYSLLGGLRSSAQMISYELSMTLSVVGVLLIAGTLSLKEIVEMQSNGNYGFLGWNIIGFSKDGFGFTQIIGFLCFFLSAIAETNRVPFDLPEAESELVAGYHTEYASMKFWRLSLAVSRFLYAYALPPLGDSCAARIVVNFRRPPLRNHLRSCPPSGSRIRSDPDWRGAFPGSCGERDDSGPILVFF